MRNLNILIYNFTEKASFSLNPFFVLLVVPILDKNVYV